MQQLHSVFFVAFDDGALETSVSTQNICLLVDKTSYSDHLFSHQIVASLSMVLASSEILSTLTNVRRGGTELQT